MFTLDKYTFDITFRNGVEITMGGKENDPVLIQIFEYLGNESTPRIASSFNMISGEYQTYKRNWYGKYEVNISKWDNELGLVHLKKITYDERNQNVLFVLDPLDDMDFKVWSDVIDKLYKEREFIPTIKYKHESFDENLYYRIYRVGRHSKDQWGNQSGWPGFIWQTWRKFWTWDNPRDWSTLTPIEIINDIVGITENQPNGIRFVVDPYYL